MEEVKSDHEPKEKIFKIFKDFMTRVAELEELATLGSRLLSGIQQGFELLRRPTIDRTSKLIENVIKANDTENIRSYFEAGCINTHDGVQSTNKSRSLVGELECLLEDVDAALQTENQLCTSTIVDEDVELHKEATNPDKKPDVHEYALLMAIIKVMVKEDYMMQEKIISGLNLNSSSEELGSYCLMWSLRPFVDEDIICRAWELIL